MKITNSDLNDLPTIFDLYRIATGYMKSKNQVAWPEFQEELVVEAIEEKKQWKLVMDNEIACIWTITFRDELIWGADVEPAMYIHRIATNPEFRGRNLVKHLVDWADGYCIENKLKYIRMDTVGFNKGLIGHYEKHGFTFLGTKELGNTNGLPEHYREGPVCLFQRDVRKAT